jgi:DNA-binding PadR family transcriptional regulator
VSPPILPMKFQDIYHFFQEPPPLYISKEVAVCYILAVLLEHGDSYGTALIQRIEQDSSLYRLSDTVLYSALKFLEDEKIIDGYWQKVEGRGRPRRMYQVRNSKLDFARQLGNLWESYALQADKDNERQSG